jgi:hypothetical protein
MVCFLFSRNFASPSMLLQFIVKNISRHSCLLGMACLVGVAVLKGGPTMLELGRFVCALTLLLDRWLVVVRILTFLQMPV